MAESRLRAVVLALAVAAGVAGCDSAPEGGMAAPPLVTGFAARQAAVQSLVVRVPGDQATVHVQRDGAQWRVAERAGWPADVARVDTLLGDLAAARRIEPKTTHPDRYPRLGVQAITDPASQGVRLDLEGGGAPLHLLLGKAKGEGERFVRLDGDAQAWLVDRPLRAPADPAEWLDTRLADAPLARIARVEVTLDTGQAFALSHRDDRFRIEGVPTAAMGDSHAGDALAGVLDQLAFEDVARDDGKAPAERTVRFIGHDGSWLQLEAWRIEGHVWVRASTSAAGDLAKALARPEAADGWRFKLPAYHAAELMAARSQILGSAP